MPDVNDPFCTIIGGPNGSGKSSIYHAISPVGEFVNADAVARRLNPASPESASMAAGRAVLQRLDELLAERRSFVYETTLSSYQSVDLMARCRKRGYQVALVYVTLASADMNVTRVAQRVAQGGHSIPAATIRRRHAASLTRLPEAIRLSHSAMVFENTDAEPEVLLWIEQGSIIVSNLDAAMPMHRLIADAVSRALNVEQDIVFRTPS